MASLITRMKARKARLIIQEPFYPSRTSRLIAQKTGAALVVVRFAPDTASGETYLGHLGALVDEVLQALGGGTP